MTTELIDLLATCRVAAATAATALRGARATEVRSKSNPRDLVTEWDLRSEELIRGVLRERAPGVAILGEEAGAESGTTPKLRFLVDPIDGTVNFAHGLPLWGVSIAVEDSDGLGVGVVVAPALGWQYFATRGAGAWFVDGNSEPTRLAVSNVSRLDHALLVTGFPTDRATTELNNFAEWEHMQRLAGACRRLGAASLDLCLVAQGSLDGYWEHSLKPWDTAAGAVIVVAAGGTTSGTDGAPFDPYHGSVVATNGRLHEPLLAELAIVARRAGRSPQRNST